MDYNTKHKHIKDKEITGNSYHSIWFGCGNDILINDSSDQNNNSFCRLGGSYELPQGMTYQSE